MSVLTTPSAQRSLPVRLCDVPFDVRCKAAREAGRGEDAATRSDLLAAALLPSTTVYYLRLSAAELIEAMAA